MADRDALLSELQRADPDSLVFVRVADLGKLTVNDMPEGLEVEPVDEIDSERVVASARYEGRLVRDGSHLEAYMEESLHRKLWPGSLGVEDYAGLVREAVEQRTRSRGDVELLDADFSDDNVILIRYVIPLAETNLRTGWDQASSIHSEILEVAEAVNAGVEDLVAAAGKRLKGWGEEPLDTLVDRMRSGTAHEKGLTLEELVSRLLGTVPGFTATGRVHTATEEIDIRIQNASEDAVWARESALLIAECKNWSINCGKNEFVLFRQKLENRTGRVSCGFLVSWNGFAETVTSEMLRGTREDLLIVPVTGEDLRAAVRENDFPERLKTLHREAVFL